MTRIQTRISHVRPTPSIHQRGTLLRLGYCGVLRAGATPAMLWRNRVLVTRSEATVDGSCSDDSESEEERAGGGPGPSRRRAGAGGPGADPCRRRLSGVLAEHSLIGWRQRHSVCERTLHVYSTYGPLRPFRSDLSGVYRYDRAEVISTLLISIRFQRCRCITDSKGGIKGSATSVVASSLTNVCCCFNSVSGLDRLFIRQLRPQDNIHPCHSLA